jgi:CubicO group peptidase (beta-lactamase class C family)
MMRPFKLLSVALGYIGVRSKDDTTTITTVGRQPTASDLACLPFLPKLFTQTPPAADHALIRAAAAKASAYLEDQFVKQKADGLSVAVITSTGTLFEQNWGVQRANESETSPAMGSHSSYRLASVSKVQLAFEGWQLEQRGIISW